MGECKLCNNSAVHFCDPCRRVCSVCRFNNCAFHTITSTNNGKFFCMECADAIRKEENKSVQPEAVMFNLKGFLEFMATPTKSNEEIVFKLDPPIKWSPDWCKLFNDANIHTTPDPELKLFVALRKPKKE